MHVSGVSCTVVRVNPQEESWSRRLTTEVGQRIRAARRREGLSAQEVSERTLKLGHEVKRAVIADMENGRRPVLPLADLLVLSAALNTPPLMLLLPPLTRHSIETLPGRSFDSSEAIDWFDGTTPLPHGTLPWSNPIDDDDDSSQWIANARPLVRRAEYRSLVAEVEAAHRKLSRLVGEAEKSTGTARQFYFDRLDAPAQELHDLLVDASLYRESAETEGSSLPAIDLPGETIWGRMRALRETLEGEQEGQDREVG